MKYIFPFIFLLSGCAYFVEHVNPEAGEIACRVRVRAGQACHCQK